MEKSTQNNRVRGYVASFVTWPYRMLAVSFSGYRNLFSGKASLNRAFWKRLILLSALFGGFGVLLVLQPYRISYNVTPSEPLGFYLYKLQDADKLVERNLLVEAEYVCPKDAEGKCIFAAVAPYPDGFMQLKEVQGIPGDILVTKTDEKGDYNVLLANGMEYYLGHISKTSPSGKPVPVVQYFREPFEIPHGYVYLGNQLTDKSFDSRYIGLYPTERLLASARKLF